MNNKIFSNSWTTPYFLYSEEKIIAALKLVQKFLPSKTQLLFTIKPMNTKLILDLIGDFVNGFAASSLFESRLAREVLGDSKSVHVTAVGYRKNEIDNLSHYCDYITFNSLLQWQLYSDRVKDIHCGLRINPQLSFISDRRYNPCRKGSKLGIPLMEMAKNMSLPQGISGIHFHSNCDATDFQQLLATVKHLNKHLPDIFSQIQWVNIGGGYLFQEAKNTNSFQEAIALLQSKDVQVFIEPGATIIRDAGYIVASVLDIIKNGKHQIAVLDTTINHMPEVFEYQFKPYILNYDKKGKYKYMLAGCSCLAGDIFGTYRFTSPLKIGSKVVFKDMGAYTLPKAHMFNGINLPTLYFAKANGTNVKIKEFTYDDFLTRCGVTFG